MIGTAISCGGFTAAFPVPYNRLMVLQSWDNRGYGLAGQSGIWHSVWLDDCYPVCTWIDVQGRADRAPVSIGPYHFADWT